MVGKDRHRLSAERNTGGIGIKSESNSGSVNREKDGYGSGGRGMLGGSGSKDMA